MSTFGVGDAPSWIQLVVRESPAGIEAIEHYTENGSVISPAEFSTPGLLAVGAAPWYDVFTIEPYSARGPTPDGRVKPDVVGATCGETALRPLGALGRGFCGTSGSAPHVAGMAALVRQRFPDYSPVQVAEYLKDSTFQFGTGDPNNTWGYGFAYLRPAVPPDAPAITIPITAGPDWLSVTWEPPGDEYDEPVTSYDLRHISSGADEAVESNWTIVADAGTPDSRQHRLTGLTGSTPYGVQVRGVNYWGEGAWSATANGITAPPVVAGPPTGLTAVVSDDETRIELAWTAPASNGGAPITGYRVESSEDGSDPWVEVYTTTDDSTTYTDLGDDEHGPIFGEGALRYYRVSAVNLVGTGPFSEPVPSVDSLIFRYDTNANGTIDRSEVIAAINDYLFGGEGETISRADVIRLITLYLFG